jgi:hypothetical protein
VTGFTGRTPRVLAFWDPIDGGGYMVGDLWVPFPCQPAINGRDVEALDYEPEAGHAHVRYPTEAWREMERAELDAIKALFNAAPANCLRGWIRGIR